MRGQTSQFIGLCKQSISDQLKQTGYLGESIFQLLVSTGYQTQRHCR